MNRLHRLFQSLAPVLLLAALPSLGAAQSPTAAQMELFRQLPPAEQQRLMREYGVQPGQTVTQGTRPSQSQDEERKEFDDEFELDERKTDDRFLDPLTGLPLFGYELFRKGRSGFRPVTDIPVPVDYMLGPGDVVVVQLIGRNQGSYSLPVNRDGAINFPELGPINVAGLKFDHARQVLQDRVSQQMIGTTVSVTMGELRSIRVFVLGDAARPGSYAVGSLATITHALLASGGISPIGSLRRIELRRNGEHVSSLDLYDLLLRGDNRNDVRLNAGDVIFVPPVGAQIAIDGEVQRPGVYEIRGGERFQDVVTLAGGLTRSAYPGLATLERIDQTRNRVVEDLDLGAADILARQIRPGDFINVPAVLERVDNAVHLAGHVHRPVRVQHHPGMRISRLIPSLRNLKPLADLNYVLIRRESALDGRVTALSADLAAALAAPGSDADLELSPGDRLFVFSLQPFLPTKRPEGDEVRWRTDSTQDASIFAGLAGVLNLTTDELALALRAERGWDDELIPFRPETRRILERLPPQAEDPLRPDRQALREVPPLSEDEFERLDARLKADRRTIVDRVVKELQLQSSKDSLAPVVRVSGRVRAPGVYPLEPGMRVSDLLRAGGKLTESAYVHSAEVTRYEVRDGEYRAVALREVDLAALRDGDLDSDLLLRPYDFLNVKEVTSWTEQESVVVGGEVRFPGTYPIRRGETLASVLERAGGLTDRAFPGGAVFTRERVRQREAQQIRELSRRMETDLATLSLQAAQSGQAQAGETITMGRALLADLQSVEPVGRVAIDLPRVVSAMPGSAEDLMLENGDRLLIPGAMQFVTVVGEVQSPVSLMFEPGAGRGRYIELSGGLTRRADGARIYVVRANGQVAASGNRRWFNTAQQGIQPGDTIVVPADIERMRPLPLWGAVTTIIYNMAVAVAAVNSF